MKTTVTHTREASTNDLLHPYLVRIGVTLGAERYAGQHPTEAAHEFANAVIDALDAYEAAKEKKEGPKS